MASSTSRAIVIIGPHHCGASSLAGVIGMLGAAVSRKLTVDQSEDDEGPWASPAITRFNDRILASACRTWDDPRPLPTGWLNPAKRQAEISEAAALLKAEFPASKLISLKDPRLSRLLPIWIPAFRAAGIEPMFLIACRNPIEIAASLKVRNGIDSDRAQLLWLSYALEAIRGTRSLPRALVHFEDLLKDWSGTLEAAFEIAGHSLQQELPASRGPLAEQVKAFLSETQRHQTATTDALMVHPGYSSLVKDLYASLRSALAPGALDQPRYDNFLAQLGGAWHIISPASCQMEQVPQPSPVLPPPAPVKQPAPAVASDNANKAGQAKRKIILHYHLFKNAGTSVDKMLKANFGAAWAEKEGRGRGWSPTEIAGYVADHPELQALSSHTALLPVPSLPDTEIFPILFLRHPLDRVRSVYEFERKQQADTEGARQAKVLDIREYVRWRLARKGDRVIRNFQAARLAQGQPATGKENEAARAMATLKSMPFIGIVENFDASVLAMESWLKPHFPSLALKATRANITQKAGLSLDQRLNELSLELGDALYRELQAANQLDLDIYMAASKPDAQ